MRKGRVVAFALVFALAMTPSAAFGYRLLGHRLKYGVGDCGASTQYYYIDSSAWAFAPTCESAMSDWVHTTSRLGITTPISYKRTTVKSSSRMDIYSKSYVFPSGVLAGTQFFNGSTLADPSVTDWVWGKIAFDQPYYSQLSNFNMKGTASHEMGHVMGLNENNSNIYAVMCQLGCGRVVCNAQKDDLAGINYLY